MSTVDDIEWMQYANCAQIGPLDSAWFPESGEAQPSIVRSICGPCEVRDKCLQYALDAGETEGYWGGVSAKARRALAA